MSPIRDVEHNSGSAKVAWLGALSRPLDTLHTSKEKRFKKEKKKRKKKKKKKKQHPPELSKNLLAKCRGNF